MPENKWRLYGNRKEGMGGTAEPFGIFHSISVSQIPNIPESNLRISSNIALSLWRIVSNITWHVFTI